jgi:mono/diheme cytochrome c family protein
MRPAVLVRAREGILGLMVLLGATACSGTDGARPAVFTEPTATAAGRCPEPRDTPRAPDSYYWLTSPLPVTPENLERGRKLYAADARPLACAACHGMTGDGRGQAGRALVPPPRNFQCAESMARVTDGQMFWIIENGSGDFHLPSRQGAQEIERPGRRTRFTAMRAYREYLDETDVWSLVQYIRSLARPP